jgi:hypothetical protein
VSDPLAGSTTLIPAVHLVCTTLMAGVIVFVQVVHYPLMAHVGEADFGGYHAGHTSRTGLGVIPLMMGRAPAHRRLSGGFDPAVHRRLVTSNWIRTVAWMTRLPVALALMG